MISQKSFESIKRMYGHCASWAIWADFGKKPKQNVGDISIFDLNKSKNILNELNPNIILCGLNISGRINSPLSNFHSSKSKAMDYKIRYALYKSPYWGAYMTDIIKDFEQKISGDVIDYLRNNQKFEIENIRIFKKEIIDIGCENPKIIAFGGAVYSILNKHFKGKYEIIKIPHYSHFISKENYRKEVKRILDF